MTRMDFGWRVPDFGEQQSGDRSTRARTFRDQIFNFMDVVLGISIPPGLATTSFQLEDQIQKAWNKEVAPKSESFTRGYCPTSRQEFESQP